jgi:hypothetical protein
MVIVADQPCGATADQLSEVACLLLWIPPLLQEVIMHPCNVSKVNKTSSPPNFSVKLCETAAKSR